MTDSRIRGAVRLAVSLRAPSRIPCRVRLGQVAPVLVAPVSPVRLPAVAGLFGLFALVALAAMVAFAAPVAAQPPAVDHDKDYVLTPVSTARGEGVPAGTTRMVVHNSSGGGVFPGTIRRVWVHLPAESTLKTVGAEGLAVIVFQDGHAYVDEQGQFRAPVVIDNLVHAGTIPPVAAIFVDPGHSGRTLPGEKPGWQPAPNNRSVEYDTLSPTYAEFLEEVILSIAASDERLKAAGVRLTADPTRRAICGISSGGICAFTVAFERPDLFANVISHVGSFTDIRGGDHYPALVRKTKGAAKPIRVALQAGENDLDNQHGNWWLGNLQMQKALAFAGYDHLFIGGVGAHNGKHGGMVLPEMLAWIWRDWRGAARPEPAR